MPIDRIGTEVAEMLRALATSTAEAQERAEREAAALVEEARQCARSLLADAELEAARLRREAAAQLAEAEQLARSARQDAEERDEALRSLAGSAAVFRELTAVLESARLARRDTSASG